MQVIRRRIAYPQDPTRYLHFEDFSSQLGDFVLLEGGFAKPQYWNEYDFTSQQLARMRSKKIVRLDFAEPTNYLVADNSSRYDSDFYKIFTLCPFTAEWLNKKFGNTKRVPVFFPINERYIPKKCKKTIDIIYSGHILARELKNELYELKNFNYAIVSNSKDKIVTHRSVSYEEKMHLYAKSRISLVHNILFKQYIHRITNIWLTADWQNNKAFKQIPPPWRFWELFKNNIYIPQLKSRVFEAAVSRSLMLCRRDDFKVIERYFEPGKEFVYYEPGKLKETVAKILANYSRYTPIIEKAYNRAIKQYTVKAFVNKYLKNIGNE